MPEEHDAAVEWIATVREELTLAGFSAGDRYVALAHVRSLLADARRLDWVEAHMAVVWPPTERSKRWVAMPVPYGSNNGDGGGASIREAIDVAARAIRTRHMTPSDLNAGASRSAFPGKWEVFCAGVEMGADWADCTDPDDSDFPDDAWLADAFQKYLDRCATATPTPRTERRRPEANTCNQIGGCKDSWRVGSLYGERACRNPNHHATPTTPDRDER